jgi:hypothetical protein
VRQVVGPAVCHCDTFRPKTLDRLQEEMWDIEIHSVSVFTLMIFINRFQAKFIYQKELLI